MVPNFKLEDIYDYSKLIKTDKIQAILKNMPSGLSKLEKAYYAYIELGKIVGRDPNVFLGSFTNKRTHYNDSIDENFLGLCKSISELYVTILREIGIDADLIKQRPYELVGSHVEVILKIDGKNYDVDLISDLVNIKSNRRLNNFGKAFNGKNRESIMYRNIIEEYGNLSCLSRAKLEEMDLKLGYSYGRIQSENGDNERGIYTNDVFHRVAEELQDPKKVNEYIVKNKKVPPDEILDYKIRFLCKNIDSFLDTSENLRGIEVIMFFDKLIQLFASSEEYKRIRSYHVKVGETNREFISILKVRPLKENGSNTYYLCADGQKSYRPITMDEIKEYLEQFDDENVTNLVFVDFFNGKQNNKKTLSEELER